MICAQNCIQCLKCTRNCIDITAVVVSAVLPSVLLYNAIIFHLISSNRITTFPNWGTAYFQYLHKSFTIKNKKVLFQSKPMNSDANQVGHSSTVFSSFFSFYKSKSFLILSNAMELALFSRSRALQCIVNIDYRRIQ